MPQYQGDCMHNIHHNRATLMVLLHLSRLDALRTIPVATVPSRVVLLHHNSISTVLLQHSNLPLPLVFRAR